MKLIDDLRHNSNFLIVIFVVCCLLVLLWIFQATGLGLRIYLELFLVCLLIGACIYIAILRSQMNLNELSENREINSIDFEKLIRNKIPYFQHMRFSDQPFSFRLKNDTTKDNKTIKICYTKVYDQISHKFYFCAMDRKTQDCCFDRFIGMQDLIQQVEDMNENPNKPNTIRQVQLANGLWDTTIRQFEKPNQNQENFTEQ